MTFKQVKKITAYLLLAGTLFGGINWFTSLFYLAESNARAIKSHNIKLEKLSDEAVIRAEKNAVRYEVIERSLGRMEGKLDVMLRKL